MCILISCGAHKDKTINEILVVIPVDKVFYYSEESEYLINNKIYSLRYKAQYERGYLIGLKKYLPDGVIDYTLEELKNDTIILKNVGLPLLQSWKIKPSLYLNTNTDSIKLIELDNSHFKEFNGKRIFKIR